MAKQKADAVDTRHYDVVLSPVITEKSTLLSEHNAVVFRVAKDASKPAIKRDFNPVFMRHPLGSAVAGIAISMERSLRRLCICTMRL